MRKARLLAAIALLWCGPLPAAPGPAIRVCLLSGSRQYDSDGSLRTLQTELETHYNAACTWVQGKDQGKDLKGLEAIDRGDVMVVFIRRMTLPPSQLKRFQAYCKAGKPIVAIRTASHAVQNWLEFDHLVLGGSYGGHSGEGEVALTIEPKAKDHPILAGVKPFPTAGGLYKNAKLAPDAQVLMTGTNKAGAQPVAWTRPQNGGRVFYTSLGDPNDFAKPGFRRMVIHAIFWTAKRTPKRIERSPAEVRADAFGKLRTHKFGQSRQPLNVVAGLVRAASRDPKQRRQIAAELAALLTEDTTPDCKRFVCRQLAVAGSDEAVPALAALLRDKDLSHMALYALARVPGPAADAALREALGAVDGPALAEVATALGERRDRASVPALAARLSHNDPAVRSAAAHALGQIGNPAAAQALTKALATAAKQEQAEVVRACLLCAEGLARSGQQRTAWAIYHQLYTTRKTPSLRVAALAGLADTDGPKAAAIVAEALAKGGPELQGAAAALVRTIRGPGLTAAFARQLPELAPRGQTLLLKALAARGDRAGAPAVVAAVGSKDRAVRVEAARALACLGDATAVPLLASAAADADRSVRDAARGALDRLRGTDVDGAMVAHLAKAPAKERAAVIVSLGQRRSHVATPALLAATKDPDAGVRREALKALGLVVDAKTMPAMVQVVLAAKPGSEQTTAEKALARAARRVTDPKERSGPVLAALAGANVPSRCSLLRVLGGIGGDAAKAELRRALQSKDPKVQDAAVRGFAEWPDATATNDLYGIAKGSPQLIHRVLALRGYVRVAGLPAKRKSEDTLALYAKAMDAAERDEERKLVLSAVSSVKELATLKMVEPYLANSALKEEAAAGVVKIASALRRVRKARPDLRKALGQVLEVAQSKRTRDKAEDLLKRIKK